MKCNDLTLWIDDDGYLATGSGDTYSTVADTNVFDDPRYSGLMDARANRIVDCVNALQGIDDPAGYIKKCEGSLAKPTPHEVIQDERRCNHCGHRQGPRMTKAQYLIDLGERLEDLELEVQRLTTIARV